MKYITLLDCVGNTPLIELKNIEKQFNLPFKLFAKLERNNPSGSVKDRTALYIVKNGLEAGKINQDSTIIEATSGNTGISLCMIASALGLKTTIVMPENVSIERRKIMKAYGANLILTPKTLGMKGSKEKADELSKNTPNSFLAHQFENESNIEAHYSGTGIEILRDLDNKVDVFISGFGTGGTLSGVSKRLKETLKNVETIGVEPKNSPLLTEGKTGPHKIQGIGANFIPNNLLTQYVDRFIDVGDDEAYEGSRILASKEGIFAGISSGAALMAAMSLDKEFYKGKNIVIILPDNGERYLSVEGLYEQ